MSMSPAGGAAAPNWNPFDLEASFQDEAAGAPPASGGQPAPPTVQASQLAPAVAAFNMGQFTAAAGQPVAGSGSQKITLGTSWTTAAGGYMPPAPQMDTTGVEGKSWSQQHMFLIPPTMQQQDATMSGLGTSPTSAGAAAHHGPWGGGAPPVTIALGGTGQIPQSSGAGIALPALAPGGHGLPITLGTSAPQGFGPLDPLPPMHTAASGTHHHHSGGVGTSGSGRQVPPGITLGSTAPIPIAGPPRMQGGIGPDPSSDGSAM